MAGHSHSANIRFRKDRVDAKRAKTFSKLSRMITVAAKEGGGDPDANAKLRLALDKARVLSMPKDGIERAIKKGTGEGNIGDFEEVVYEGYGPGGVAVMMEILTDPRIAAGTGPYAHPSLKLPLADGTFVQMRATDDPVALADANPGLSYVHVTATGETIGEAPAIGGGAGAGDAGAGAGDAGAGAGDAAGHLQGGRKRVTPAVVRPFSAMPETRGVLRDTS